MTLPNSSGGGSGGGGFSTGIGGALPLELQMIVAINARILLLVVLLPALLIVVVIVSSSYRYGSAADVGGDECRYSSSRSNNFRGNASFLYVFFLIPEVIVILVCK